MNIVRRGVILAGALLLAAPAWSNVRLPKIVGNGMVLQRDTEVRLWGWADEGEKVTVIFNGQEAAATAKDGQWRVTLKPMKAGGPLEMTISGKNKLVLPAVYIGEVWLASGQSNMQIPLNSVWSAAEKSRILSQPPNPQIRFFVVPGQRAEMPTNDVGNWAWQECNSNTVPYFSAVAYYFARDLQRAWNVPVGVFVAAAGATRIEAWTSREALAANPDHQRVMDKLVATVKAQDAAAIAAAEQKAQALKAAAQTNGAEDVARSETAGQQLVEAARQRARDRAPVPVKWRPYRLFNGFIAPLMPYVIRGALWYQGESNAGEAWDYRRQLTDLIQSWRQGWQCGDFPFLIVQLAPHHAPNPQPQESIIAEMREAQWLATRALPKVWLAVITDAGCSTNIHPPNKEPAGARLALAARAIAGGENIVYSGPEFESITVRGSNVVLRFRHVGAGLVAKDGPLTGFALAGADRKFVWGQAEIAGETVVVSGSAVANPVAVRYGWADYPVVNLWNKDGLPAVPFRTDDFPLLTQPKP